MKRPFRTRIWAWKPWPGYVKTDTRTYLPKGWWKPWGRGADEFNWHTVHIGMPVIGMIHFATRPCPGEGEAACVEMRTEFPEMFEIANWPVDSYGHNHVECNNPDCYCKDDDDDT